MPFSSHIHPCRGGRIARSILGAGALCLAAASQALGAEVNVYSYRQEGLIRPLLDQFTRETGIAVRLVSGGEDALIERLVNEGANSPADVLLTVDVGRLVRAKEAGVLQAATSGALQELVPARYRDPEGFWYGLSVRARPIMYATGRVKPDDLSTYEALADAKWRGRVCVRSSSHVYNQSLLASIIAAKGKEKAEKWAAGLAMNLARKPQGGDRDQIKALAAGECDVALANTYYLAGMRDSTQSDEREAARKVAVFWPNQADRGAHVNISGGALTKSGKNRAEAIKLLEFLAGPKAQKLFAEVVQEYPLHLETGISPALASFGQFRADTLDLASLARYSTEAVRIFDRVQWR